jgi:gas vesicle protein
MAQNVISKGNYFLMGIGIGSLIGLLFAPKSGVQTREYLAKKANKAKEFARLQARDLRNRAEDAVESGMETISQTKEQIAMAINAGREAYNRERLKANVR